MTTKHGERGERSEGRVQVVIMLVIGAMAGAASFTHVHDVAVTHGQSTWIGWADAVVVELMSLALGLELRRRARTGRPTDFVLTSLVCFIAVSLAAQVVEAEPSVVGWLAAALPALGFLVLAKVVLSRTAATAFPADEPTTDPTTVDTNNGDPLAADAHRPVSVGGELVDQPDAAPVALLTGARIVADSYRQATGTTITRDALAERMRVTPDTADRLIAALGQPPTPAVALANGHTAVGAHT
jgi:hypothetical protein